MLQPIRLALINDHPLVVQGLRALLSDQAGIEVVELDAVVQTSRPVDIALIDLFGQAQPTGEAIRRRLQQPTVGKVAIYTWHTTRPLVEEALSAGASGVLSKTLPADRLAGNLVRIARGERIVDDGGLKAHQAEEMAPSAAAPGKRDWPGRSEGLSMREAEMITLISQGLSNDEICERLFLSLNSVKSYIRTAYHKIGVQSRSQAVIWGIEHGLRPTPTRQLD